MSVEHEYILGTERDELERLRFQHGVWVEQARALWRRAGVAAGQAVLDLGCGPGYTSFELADVVGPEGSVVARDVSARFIDHLAGECVRSARVNVTPSLGPVEDLELPAGSLDAVYARWLFCWLPDPGAVLAHAARALRPGGAVVLQEYVDWGAMKLLPPSAPFATAVAACMRSWASGAGTIDIGAHVPALAAERGLRVELLEPVARLGAVGSPEWRWVGEFHHVYLPKLVARGLLAEADLSAFRADWEARTAAGLGACLTPTMVDVILRKP